MSAAASVLAPGGTRCVFPKRICFVKENGSWRVAAPHEQTKEFLEKLWASPGSAPTTPQVAAADFFRGSTRCAGLWTPILFTRRVPSIPTMWHSPGCLTTADTSALATLFANEALRTGLITSAAEHQALVTGVPVVTTSINTLGPLNDLSVLVAFSLLALGQVHRFRSHRALHQSSQARCPRCTYSLQGLSAPRCPECGESIERVPT